MLSIEGPIERFCRRGGDLRSLREESAPPPMPVEQIVANAARTILTPYGEQDANGVDLSLIRSNLQRTVTDRIQASDAARRAMLRMMNHDRPD